MEGRAAVGISLGPDAAGVLLDNRAADSQPQAAAAFLPGVGVLKLLKAVEDGFELVVRNAAALIDDREGYALGTGADEDRDTGARRREFDRIGE